MMPYRKPPENIIITTKYVNGVKIFLFNNKGYATEYLARKAAQLAAKAIEKSIKKTYV